jgi:hypothetical protein
MTWTGSHRTVVTVMSPTPLASLAGGRRVPRTCPTCRRFLTAKLICWQCCERLCRLCGNPTGSAFIETCWPCSYWQDAGREAGRDLQTTKALAPRSSWSGMSPEPGKAAIR